MKKNIADSARSSFAIAAPLAAQDLTITNARIVVGNGPVIENGHIIMRSGRIAVVAPGAPASTQGPQVVDAQGMSAMAGFIDGHRHVNNGPSSEAQMRSLLEAGYTTILAGGGAAMDNLTLSANVETGIINGPRIIPSERLRLAGGDAGAGARSGS